MNSACLKTFSISIRPLAFLCTMAFAASLLGAAPNTLTPGEKTAGWQLLFDGQSLDGWKASETPGTFSVREGEIVVHGARSHLFYTGAVQQHEFKNFEFSAEVMTWPGANSGVYFHTAWQETGWPEKGYEVQVDNSHKDPSRTAGLYGIKANLVAPAKDNEWFTMTVRVEGKHVVTAVNGRVIIDYTEEEKPERPKNFAGRLIGGGTFALQGHDPGSEVHFRNIKVRVLP
jgi:hypothetical protein